MAEYLSPGVYVEEFESGGNQWKVSEPARPVLLDLQKRAVEGVPQLVTNC